MKHIDKTTQAHPYKLGKNYFVRTVTYHYTGKLVGVFEQELVLTECAWIADDGKFSDAMETGIYSEVEVYPKEARVAIGRGAILDAHVSKNPLPTATT